MKGKGIQEEVWFYDKRFCHIFREKNGKYTLHDNVGIVETITPYNTKAALELHLRACGAKKLSENQWNHITKDELRLHGIG